MNEDDFLSQFHKPPRPEFAKRLYAKLSKEDDMSATSGYFTSTLNGAKPHVIPPAPRRNIREYRLTLVAAVTALTLLGGILLRMNHQESSYVSTLIQSPNTLQLAPISENNVSQLKKLAQLGEGYLNGVSWSSDGKLLALAGSIGAWIYDADNLDAPLQYIEDSSGSVTDIRFSPDNTMLAISSIGGFRLWDLTANQPIDLPDQISQSTALASAFHPDGETFVTTGYEGTLHFWNLKTGEELSQINVFFSNTPIFSLSFSPDGTRLLFAGSATPPLMLEDTTAQWRNLEGKQPVAFRSEYTEGYGVGSVGFNADSSQIAAQIGTNVVIWDTATTQVVTAFSTATNETIRGSSGGGGGGLKGGGGILSPFSPDGKFIATIDRGVRIWDIATGTSRTVVEPDPENYAGFRTLMSFNPDWSRMAFIDNNSVLHLLDVDSGKEVMSLDRHTYQAYTEVVFNPSGDQLAGLNDRGVAYLWDVKTLTDTPTPKLLTRSEPSFGNFKINYRPDGTALAMLAAGIDITLWDLTNLQPAMTLDAAVSNTLPTFPGFITYGADQNTLIASVGDSQIVRVWDTETNEIVREFTVERPIREGIISADGRLLALSYGPTLEEMTRGLSPDTTGPFVGLWDMTTGEEIIRYEIAPPIQIAFSPDGTKLVVTTENGQLLLWNIDSENQTPVLEQQRFVQALAFSPDGSLLAFSEQNVDTTGYSLVVMSTRNGEILTRKAEQEYIIVDMAFSPDSRLIAAGTFTGIINIWGVE